MLKARENLLKSKKSSEDPEYQKFNIYYIWDTIHNPKDIELKSGRHSWDDWDTDDEELKHWRNFTLRKLTNTLFLRIAEAEENQKAEEEIKKAEESEQPETCVSSVEQHV